MSWELSHTLTSFKLDIPLENVQKQYQEKYFIFNVDLPNVSYNILSRYFLQPNQTGINMAQPIDLTGKKFNKLTVIERAENNKTVKHIGNVNVIVEKK